MAAGKSALPSGTLLDSLLPFSGRRRNDKNSLQQKFSDSYGPLVRPAGGLSVGSLPGWHGMENGQKPEMKKKWKSKWKTAPSWTGAKMAKKMAQKWKSDGVFHYFPFFGHFFCHFCPCPARGRFPFRFPFFFFSVSGFWPFSMPCQPGKLLSLVACFAAALR